MYHFTFLQYMWNYLKLHFDGIIFLGWLMFLSINLFPLMVSIQFNMFRFYLCSLIKIIASTRLSKTFEGLQLSNFVIDISEILDIINQDILLSVIMLNNLSLFGILYVNKWRKCEIL